jgi:2-polyprenyl-3-methyl-5-hydroxy-6-metoxy-1,4-benzoquinol methylase
MPEPLQNVRSQADTHLGATSEAEYDAGWQQWADMVKYSPAPFHRRRLIMDLARRVTFSSVADIGCGTGELIRAFHDEFKPARMLGADLSPAVVTGNQQRMPYAQFMQADLASGPLPGEWDLIVCSEVIEHIKDYDAALQHLRTMCTGHLIVTVPSGRIFPIDLQMGHFQHFSGAEMHTALTAARFAPMISWHWGFPWHTAYKHLINISPERSMQRFSGGNYSTTDKLIAQALTALFYLNVKQFGKQLIVLAKAI